jgi:tetratricopeptide (TPR) repeat protein
MHCWVDDWDARQAYLVKLVKALVDQGDLRGAREAMAALDEVEGYGDKGWKAQALVEIARREEPGATLQQALAALDDAPMLTPGDRTAHADTLAQIAEGLAAAGQRTQAIGLMPRALAVLGPTDSIETMEIWSDLACQSLTRIARAEVAIGRRDEALALLQRTERLIASIPVPPPEKDADPTWDRTAMTQKDRVAGRFRIAAALEDAGEHEQAERVLADALKELAAIRNADWREYGWQALVEVYGEVGRLDRAMEQLTAGLRGEPDRWLAISNIGDEDLLAAPRPQLWGILDALPAGWQKATLATRLAKRLDALGEQTSVSRLVTEALTSAAAVAASGEKDWQLELVEVGGELPGAERPGNAEQQRLVRTLLAAVPAKAAAPAKSHR